MIGSGYRSVLEAARLGADWAWSAIYRDLAPALLRYLAAHGAREPEDLLGEVFVQLVRNIASFEGSEREFRAWSFTIARNRLIDEWRRLGRRPYLPVSNGDLASKHVQGDGEAEAMAHLADESVIDILQRLSIDQRDVLFLRVLAGFSIEETARILGKRAGAVKALQSRATARIRREIKRKAVTFS